MEGILRVTPEQLEAASGEFSAKGTAVGNLTAQMMQTVESLGNVWEGTAASVYAGRFRRLDGDIQKMVRMIREHAEDLNEMAKVYRDAESVNQDEIAGLESDIIV